MLALCCFNLPQFSFVDTFDLIMAAENELLLLDFGPLTSKTNYHAFKWSEIQDVIKKVSGNEVACSLNSFYLQNSSDEVMPVFRYLESNVGILTPSLCKTVRME